MQFNDKLSFSIYIYEYLASAVYFQSYKYQNYIFDSMNLIGTYIVYKNHNKLSK